MTIKVLVVADAALRDEMPRRLNAGGMHLELVGSGEDHTTAVRRIAELDPEIVIIDTELPNLDVSLTFRRILAQKSTIRIIALSGRATHAEVVATLVAGAHAYLPSRPNRRDLRDAIEAVVTNRIYISPHVNIAAGPRGGTEHSRGDLPVESVLSRREQEVLKILADGKTSRQIAECLFISEKTVESHRRNIMAKLGIHSIAELTKYAVKHKITPIDF